jgi:hypothetical protein
MEFSKDKLNSFTAPQTIKFDNMSIVDLATADDFLFIKDAMLTRYTSRLADLQKEFDNL